MIRLVTALLFTCCVTLATILDPAFQDLRPKDDSSSGVLVALMGDSRRLFAHQFFSMADAYFHSGFYPSIFDSKKAGESDLVEESHDKSKGEAEHEEESSFLGPPKDPIERFGRNFMPTVHTHLQGGNQREMLPWLKLAAEMDPHEIIPYLTASYWLRTSLNQPKEAEEFLREGLRANPDSYEILLELGRIYFYNWKNVPVAKNIFLLARLRWQKQEAAGLKPDQHAYEEILGEIVRVDQEQGDLKQQLADMEELLKVARGKPTVQKQIDELKAKLSEQSH